MIISGCQLVLTKGFIFKHYQTLPIEPEAFIIADQNIFHFRIDPCFSYFKNTHALKISYRSNFFLPT
jgi:hypothetical protein